MGERRRTDETRRDFVKQAGMALASGVLGSACRPCRVAGPDAMLDQLAGAQCTASHVFENWAHTIRFQPNRFCRPRREEDVVAIVKAALAEGKHVRTQGAGHSFSQLLPTSDTLLTLDDLAGTISVDGTRATVPGGIRLKNLIPELRKRNLGLRNLGSITEQSIAGAFSTGTHGSGIRLGAIPTQVVGVRLVDGNGDVRTVTESDKEELAAARINIGALGIITQVTLDCVEDYELEYTASLTTFDEVLPRIEDLVKTNDRFVLWWLVPEGCDRDAVVVITKNAFVRSARAPSKASGGASSRKTLAKSPSQLRSLAAQRKAAGAGFKQILNFVAPYDQVLTIPLLPVFHRECEYAIPAAKTVEALRAMREIVEEGDIALSLPVEVRFVAQDDILLSPSNEGPVAFIGASTLVNSTEVFERFEPLMKSLGGRPHWGKNATVTQKEIATEMFAPTYERFRKVRNAFDPKRVFTNSLLTDLFP